jgi:hypothetical protein
MEGDMRVEKIQRVEYIFTLSEGEFANVQSKNIPELRDAIRFFNTEVEKVFYREQVSKANHERYEKTKLMEESNDDAYRKRKGGHL